MADEKSKSDIGSINEYKKSAPVDVISLAGELSIKLVSIDLKKINHKYSDMIFVFSDEQERRKTVAIDKQDDNVKKRFAAALGVSIFVPAYEDRLKTGLVFKWNSEKICYSEGLSDSENKDVVQSALELLIPSDLLLQEVLKWRNEKDSSIILESLMKAFGVSNDMIMVRLRYLIESQGKES